MNETPTQFLQLAPSTLYPARSGDARRIIGIANGFLESNVECVTVGKNFVHFSDEHVIQFAYPKGPLQRNLRAIIACLRRGHYNEAMHCTAGWKKRVEPYLLDRRFNAIFCNFIWTYPLIAEFAVGRRLIVDTHNSEWDWYKSLKDSSNNPIIRQLCDFSFRRSTQIMAMLPVGTVMTHVSTSDMEAYKNVRQDLDHVVLPNGAGVRSRKVLPDYQSTRKTLLFVGSLGVKMNLDALKHFEQKFWPILKDHVKVIVAGSNPSGAVQRLVTTNGWEIRPNLSDEQLDTCFEEAHFAILPFEYGNGSKLKFFDACSRGIPILSTESGACGQEFFPSIATLSNDPKIWLERILQRQGISEIELAETEKFAAEFSWKSVVGKILHKPSV